MDLVLGALQKPTALAMMIWLCGATNVTLSDSQPTEAEIIFSRVRDVLSNQQCPTRLEYVIVVSASVNGHLEQNHFRASYLYDLDYLHVADISDEEQRSATAAHGTNISIELPGGLPLLGLSRTLTNAVNREDDARDLIGVPDLKPSYTFGIARHMVPQSSPDTIESQMPQATSQNTGAKPLVTIGTVQARVRDYKVDLIGLDRYEDSQAYHLRLTPLHDPTRFRLREMWVDAKSYSTLQVESEGNFSDGPPTKVRWLTTFQTIAGCRVLRTETALSELDYGRNRKYEDTTISFSIMNSDPDTDRTPVLTFRRPQDKDDIVEPDE